MDKLKSRGTDLKALAAADKLFMVTYDVLKPYERTRKQAEDTTFLLPLPVVLLELRDNTLMPLVGPCNLGVVIGLGLGLGLGLGIRSGLGLGVIG